MIETCVPLARNDTRSGVINGESNVETVVIPTENATSPPQRYDIMFEETPPGQHPTRISPSAIPSGRFNAFEIPNARNGMIVRQSQDLEGMIMKYDERACKFNIDTGCVELLLRDGRKISIDCTGVEDALNATMAQQTELDYLIYNDPLGYADLILNGDPEEYLKNAAGSHGLED